MIAPLNPGIFRTRTRRDGELFRQEHAMRSKPRRTQTRFDRVGMAVLTIAILLGIVGNVLWG